MGQIIQQGKGVDALKLLNNAIVTSRLYPPESPQVATAVERGYKGLKLFLRDQGPLLFSFKDDAPSLCGQPLQQEVLDSFPNLIVFRQLRMLGLMQLLIGADMDRFAFGQILSVFNTTPEKAKKSGGGVAYITGLGLASYFPEEPIESDKKIEVTAPVQSRTRKLIKVQPELLACLCGLDRGPAVQAELQQRLATIDSAVDLLAAGVGHILQEIFKKGGGGASSHFPTMLRSAETILEEGARHEVSLGLARVLVENLRAPALCVLLCQDFPEGFGEQFYDGLIGFLNNENLTAVFVVFREQIAKVRQIDGDSSPSVDFFGKAMLKLMNTGKGKQYIGAEKARTLIHEGEVARKKRRLEAGIHGLLQGNLNALNSEELVQYLPEVLTEKFVAKALVDVELLLQRFAAYLAQEIGKIGDSALLCSVVIGEKLLGEERLDLFDIFLDQIIAVVQKQTLPQVVGEKLIVFLHKLMQVSWSSGDNRRGDGVLALFYAIRSGQISKSKAFRDLVGKVQDRGIQRAKLPALLAECLASPLDDILGCRLVLQGPVAVRFLVESLINTEDMDDRIKIIDLLTSTSSNFLAPIIHERLPEHMPWYGKRNLLKLLGEAGKEEDAESALPFLKHDDFRVQREAFLCLYKIGGKNRKKLFLAALADSSELIKVQIIEALSNFCDFDVATQLSQLLAEHQSFSDKNFSEIVCQLLETLGRCANPVAHKGVEAFLQTKGQRTGKRIPETIWNAAEDALRYLENDLQENKKKYVLAGQLRKNALKQVAKQSKETAEQKFVAGLPQEQNVRALLNKGDSLAAKDMLVQLIEKSARARNFVQAEKLREWLIEIDPTAFSHIIQVAEFIEREKIASIDKGHMEIWNNLYECLSSEEFAAVYHALQHRKYLSEETIVSQGTMQTSLFFINSGKVKLYFADKGQEVLISTMGRGEVFGAEVFFDASIWTVSVASIGPSEISFLKLDKLKEWQEEYPGLESKLREFSLTFNRVEDFLEKNERDRRTQERHKISGRVSTTLIDEHGQSLGISTMVELLDISIGGVAYQARISKKENARLLLGRKVQVKVPEGEKTGEFAHLDGDILAVRSISPVENDYSVHVKFETPLDRRQLQEIIRAARWMVRV